MQKTTPRRRVWWPLIVGVVLLGAGLLIAIVNYIGVFGATRNWPIFAVWALWLLGLLFAIVGAVVAATVRR